jgi:hypothetical protein
VGITKEFSVGDKVLAYALVIWNFGWLTAFFIITALNLVVKFSDAWWSGFWKLNLWLNFCIGIPATIWFTVGGISDIKGLFHILKHTQRDQTDDGRVQREEETEQPPTVPAER